MAGHAVRGVGAAGKQREAGAPARCFEYEWSGLALAFLLPPQWPGWLPCRGAVNGNRIGCRQPCCCIRATPLQADARALRGVLARTGGEYGSLLDFCARVESAKLNRRTLEAIDTVAEGMPHIGEALTGAIDMRRQWSQCPDTAATVLDGIYHRLDELLNVGE